MFSRALLLVHKHVKAWRDAAVLSHLRQRHAVRGEDLSRGRRALRIHASWGAVDDCDSRNLMIDGIPAWSDEGWDLASCVAGRPSLRHGTVVVLLLMVAVRNVLSSHGSVETRVVLMDCSRVRVTSREHEVVGCAPKSSGNRETVELVASSSHGGGLRLVRVGGIVEIHALKTMSQCRHVGSSVALLGTITAVVVGVGVASQGLAIA
ncbi:hypothetical protein KCU93_g86, partial [Aureobasidium melanogenum]